MTTLALPTFITVSAGGVHTCALDTGGKAYCWGGNSDGQVGDGSFSPRRTPVPVKTSLRFLQISAGFNHTCAIATNEQAYCWGGGPLGDGQPIIGKATPVAVAGARKFRNISAGNEHTCAVNLFDVAFCWGLNGFGQLGTGGGFTNVPVKVAGNIRWRRVAAGGQVSCGVTTTDVPYCWGLLGGKTPTKVSGGRLFRQVWVGGGDFTDAQHNEPDSPHACGITSDDRAFCWGEGNDGQLGQGTGTSSSTPVAVAGSRRWSRVIPGHYHTCGVTLANVAFCWGLNQWGSNGNGSFLNSEVPVKVNGGISFSIVSTGIAGLHTCGMTGAGKIYCWGTNSTGQLGDGTITIRLAPVPVIGGS